MLTVYWIVDLTPLVYCICLGEKTTTTKLLHKQQPVVFFLSLTNTFFKSKNIKTSLWFKGDNDDDIVIISLSLIH